MNEVGLRSHLLRSDIMQRPEFVNNEIYHIYNRGVEKRDIFLGRPDKFRFIYSLFEFNSNIIAQRRPLGARLRQTENSLKKNQKPLVEILAFCLMPNHYHLLLTQKEEGGITKFMRKLGTGYTNYFNLKYKRSGVLFQGKFKAVLVTRDSHFLYLPYYIHFNPLDLFEPSWREGRIKEFDKIVNFLESYRWSSFLDYIGQKNFPFVTQRDFLLSFYKDQNNYKKETLQWLKEMDPKTIDEFERN